MNCVFDHDFLNNLHYLLNFNVDNSFNGNLNRNLDHTRFFDYPLYRRHFHRNLDSSLNNLLNDLRNFNNSLNNSWNNHYLFNYFLNSDCFWYFHDLFDDLLLDFIFNFDTFLIDGNRSDCLCPAFHGDLLLDEMRHLNWYFNGPIMMNNHRHQNFDWNIGLLCYLMHNWVLMDLFLNSNMLHKKWLFNEPINSLSHFLNLWDDLFLVDILNSGYLNEYLFIPCWYFFWDLSGVLDRNYLLYKSIDLKDFLSGLNSLH